MSATANQLTAGNCRTLLQRHRLRDNGLQRALATYEALAEDRYDERLKSIASVTQLANALKRNRDVAANSDAVDELTEIISAANEEQRDLTRARAEAQRAQVASRGGRATPPDDEGDEEEEDGSKEYGARLLAALEKLKRSRDLSYPFIVCEGKPFCGLMIAKRITPQHRAELTRLTGGRRFFPGTCSMESSILNFHMERPPTGLARKLQESIRQFTGRRIRVTVGTETAEDEDDEGAPNAGAGTIAPEQSTAHARSHRSDGVPEPGAGEADDSGSTGQRASPTSARPQPVHATTAQAESDPAAAAPRQNRPRATLARAPQVWQGTRGILERRLEALKQAVRAEYANDEPELLREINQRLGRLDSVLDNLDHRLADALGNANEAATQAARTSQLRNARTILTGYINYVRTEPLIAAIDQNPFGINTSLRRLLTDSLTHMAQAIGTGAGT